MPMNSPFSGDEQQAIECCLMGTFVKEFWQRSLLRTTDGHRSRLMIALRMLGVVHVANQDCLWSDKHHKAGSSPTSMRCAQSYISQPNDLPD